MPNQDGTGFQDVIAESIRRIRAERGWSQHELAERARLMGLTWNRSTIADIEAAERRRDITVEEFVLLPQVLGVELVDLLGADPQKWIQVGVGQVKAVALFSILTGNASEVRSDEVTTLNKALKGSVRMRPPDQRINRVARRWLKSDMWGTYRIVSMAKRQAENHAANVLANEGYKVDAIDVVDLSYRRWGKGLTEERDARLAALSGEGDVSRRRGHISRQLIQELRQELSTKGKTK